MHLLIAHNAYGKPSGEEQAVASIEAMMVANGHRVSRFERSSAEIGDSHRHKLRAAAAGVHNPFERRRMSQTLADLAPDVVLAQNLYPFLSPSILQACRARGVPVVMRCSNYRLFCPSGLHLSGGAPCERCLGPGREVWCVLKNCEGSVFKSAGYALRNATARIGRRIVDAVDAFVVLTEFQKRRFMANGIPAAQLAVIGNHVDVARPIAGVGRLVSFIGRVAPEKGIAEFLGMARRLPAIPFAVAGAVKPGAEGLVQNLPPNVQLLGHLERPQLQALLDETRVVVACSQWFEGFPHTVLEAMAAGRPVLATNIGGLPEIVDHDETGLLYQPGDLGGAINLLRKLYQDPGRCRSLGAAGRAKAESRYARSRVYDAYLDVFRRVQRAAVAEQALDPACDSCAVPLG